MIAIRNLTMPESCSKCLFWWLGFDHTRYCLLDADKVMTATCGREEWCPLVPVRSTGGDSEKSTEDDG